MEERKENGSEKALERADFPEERWMWKDLVLWAPCSQRSRQQPQPDSCGLFLTVFTPATGPMLISKTPFPGYSWAISGASMTLLTSGKVPVDR